MALSEVEDYQLKWVDSVPEKLSVGVIQNVNSMTFMTATQRNDIDHWDWDFGDGEGTGHNPSPTYRFKASGNYLVTAKAFSSGGSLIHEWQQTVSNTNTTQSSFSVQSDGKTVTLKAENMVAPTGTIIRWDMGDNSVLQETESPSYQYAERGIYTVKMILINPDYPAGISFSKTVDLNEPAFEIRLSTQLLGMQNNQYHYALKNLTDLPEDRKSDQIEVNWVLGDGTENTDTTPAIEHQYGPGRYQVKLTQRYQQSTGPKADGWRWREASASVELVLESQEPFLYCESSLTGENYHIAQVTIGDTDFNTNNDTGLINPGNPVAISNASITIRIQAGTIFSLFRPAMYIGWLDVNHDGVFSDEEKLFSFYDAISKAQGNGYMEQQVDLPLGSSAPGHHRTRLRILQVYSPFGAIAFSPCEDFSTMAEFGEIEDYLLQWGTAPELKISLTQQNKQITIINQTADLQNYQWAWDFGDGSSDKGPNPNHSYKTPGQYLLQLKVYSSSGEIQGDWQQTITIAVQPALVLNTEIDGKTLLFDASDSQLPNESTVTIDFGDGTSSHDLTGKHTYANDGTYSVVLTVVNAEYPEGITQSTTIEIGSSKSGAFGLEIILLLFTILGLKASCFFYAPLKTPKV